MIGIFLNFMLKYPITNNNEGKTSHLHYNSYQTKIYLWSCNSNVYQKETHYGNRIDVLNVFMEIFIPK